MNVRLLLGAACLLATAQVRSEADLYPKLLQLADARSFDAETLAAAAASPEPKIRLACARLLGHLRQDGAARLALRLAHDSAVEVRAEALASLGRLLPWLGAGPLHQKTLKTMVFGLAHGDGRVRKAAAWALAASGEGGNALLSAVSREKDLDVKAFFLRQLWRFSQNSWLSTAVAYAQAGEAELRRAAVWSLARASSQEASKALLEALQDPDPQVRLWACEGLGRYKNAAAVTRLVPLLEDGEERVRVAALEALAALGPAARTAVPSKFQRVLANILAEEDLEHPHRKVAAIKLAGTLGCCQGELTRLVDDGGWFAGVALSALARQGARELVEEELASADVTSRVWATKALGELRDGAGLLSRAAADANVAVRLAAAEVARGMPAESAVPVLQKLLKDADGAVRAQACESLDALGATPDEKTLADLLDAAKDQGGDAAITLVRLLGKAPSLAPEAVSALEKARLSPEFAVALAAWKELFRHGRIRAFPGEKPMRPLSFYQEVARFASQPRYLEVVTLRGTFTVALDVTAAPLSAFALSQLAEKGFFDKLTFHRVVSNFVVQGGDPRGDGWGGPGFFLRDELSLAPFQPGAVGLALAGPDTGGSQFFVTLTTQPHLEGFYPRIGRVVSGMEVVERLQVGDTIIRIRAGTGEPPTPIPVWYGPLSLERLEKSIPEFAENQRNYQPQESWLAHLRSSRHRYGLVVVMGTWCSDSREQVPRLLKIVDALGSANPFDEVKLLGVDRGKQVVPGAAFPYGPVERVPTIVVTLEGSEVGRIVESPLSPSLEEDLVRILAPLEGWEIPEGGATLTGS
ncbi:MAG: HEAT repeat domain-containing protein [Thermoanaerobaculaceae bacterium]